jgi:tetratricopeptide (TPR) repeat protein
MEYRIVRTIAITLAGCLSAFAQQNTPCPSYQKSMRLLDDPYPDVPSIKEVKLCLDDQESPPERHSNRTSRTIPIGAREQLALGVDCARKGLDEEARQHFVEAVEIDPFYLEAVAHLGAAMVRLHQPSQALEFLLRAIMIDRWQSSTHSNMAWAMLQLGKSDFAEGYARQAVALAPSSEAANYVLAWTLILQLRRSPEASNALSIAERRFLDAPRLREWSDAHLKAPQR